MKIDKSMENILKHKTKRVHISTIRHGDTIIHLDGQIRTVSNSNIKLGFCGTTLFGDSYKMGTTLVKLILI